jgi:hypothetical protein
MSAAPAQLLVCATVLAAFAGCAVIANLSDYGPMDSTSADSDAAKADDGGPAEGAPCTVDVASDPFNCGRCGHDCLGGACADAQCQPSVLLSGLAAPQGVALDRANLYWSEPTYGQIHDITLDGGVRSIVVADASAPTYLAVAGGELYWTENLDGGSVQAHTLSSGTMRTVAEGLSYPAGLAVSGGVVYFTLQVSNTLALALPDAGTQAVTDGLDFPESIATDPTTVYVASPRGHIFAVDQGDAAITKLADGLRADAPVGIALDGTTLFITYRETGMVVAMEKSGGAITVLAIGQDHPMGIAVDSTALYWANNGSGSIMRLAR